MNSIQAWKPQLPVVEYVATLQKATLETAMGVFLQSCAHRQDGHWVSRCPKFTECVDKGLFGHKNGAKGAQPVCLVNTRAELNEAIARIAMHLLSVQADAVAGVQTKILAWVEEEGLQREGATGFDDADQWADSHGVKKPRSEDRKLWGVVYPFITTHPQCMRGVGDATTNDMIARAIGAITDSNRRYMAHHLANVIEDDSLTEGEKVEQVNQMLSDAEEMTRNQLWEVYRDPNRSVPPMTITIHKEQNGNYRFTGLADQRQLALLRSRLGIHATIEVKPTST